MLTAFGLLVLFIMFPIMPDSCTLIGVAKLIAVMGSTEAIVSAVMYGAGVFESSFFTPVEDQLDL